MIGRLKEDWQGEYERWQRRDLSARRYVHIWADGVYLQARMDETAACMLVVIGATPEGRKELVGFQVGVRGADGSLLSSSGAIGLHQSGPPHQPQELDQFPEVSNLISEGIPHYRQ